MESEGDTKNNLSQYIDRSSEDDMDQLLDQVAV